MQRDITATIEISAPPWKVFSFWTDIEKRMRVNPGWDVLSIKKLTEGPFTLGSEFIGRVKGAKGEIEYISKCIEFEMNKKIVTQSVGLDSDLKWQTSVGFDKTPNGTRLRYTETVEVPRDVIGETEEFNRHVKNWLEGVKRYLEIKDDALGRFKIFLLDRYWLRWSPRKRNIVKLVILLEAATMMAAMIALGVIAVLTRSGMLV
jgi:uncharacterized protein YndB with AHSA1/START domain